MVIGGMTEKLWYEQTHNLHYYAKYSLVDIMNMLPYEVDIYLGMYVKTRQDEEKQRNKKK